MHCAVRYQLIKKSLRKKCEVFSIQDMKGKRSKQAQQKERKTRKYCKL